MPIEVVELASKPQPLEACPECGAKPFDAFMRGQVQSTWRYFLGLPYCAVICFSCKDIVGYEKSETKEPK